MNLAHLFRLLFLALVCLSGSCRTWEKAKFNHGDGVAEETVFVVPFSESKRSLWYGDSEDGKVVMEAFMEWAQRNADPEFPEGEIVDTVLRRVREWQGMQISSADWKRLASPLGARYVLHGDIVSLALERPDRVGMLTPAVQAKYSVVDLEQGKAVYQSPTLTVETGTAEETETLLGDLGSDRKAARRQLLYKLGTQIGKDLYGYYRR